MFPLHVNIYYMFWPDESVSVVTMHLIITNIPEDFRSSDLRNFFSEAIEKETFTCFHFRHRPQTHLLSILKNSSHASPDDEPQDDTKSDQSRSNYGLHSSESDGANVSLNTKTSHSQTPKLSDVTSYDDDRSERGGTQARYGSGGGDSANQPSDSSKEDEAEGERGGGDGSKTHWLSAGLAGLASIIREKKLQGKPNDKWSHSAQGSVRRTCSGIKGIQNVTKGDHSCDEKNTKSEPSSPSLEVLSPHEEETSRRTCCVVEVKDGCGVVFMRRYDRKHWLSRSGDILPQRCYILKVDFNGATQSAGKDDYKTREEHSALSLMSSSPQDLLEFQPPPIMPQGNVGTPTSHFKKLIRTCQMPGVLIKKLGLEFPRGRGKKRFGQVPFDYGTSVVSSRKDKDQTEKDIVFTASGNLIPTSADFEEQEKRRKKERKKKTLLKGPRMELEKEDEDGAEVQEWERYEPFHEDVTSQDRIKERRYEEELEVVWEKGGSGLVFYTDAQYWRAQQGDFDEQTADEWDVDMSVYYEEGAGDKDARDGVDMINSEKFRSGKLTSSAFGKRKEEGIASIRGKRGRGRRKIGPSLPPTIGKFEAHTKGFGRRMMEAQGWQEGQGLGVGSGGMPYALEGDGQHPLDRKGFGYHGEKLQGWTSSSTSSSSSITHKSPRRHHHISTIFDRTEDIDPSAPPLRTPEPTTLSHRHRQK